jgi:hypothetical protein
MNTSGVGITNMRQWRDFRRTNPCDTKRVTAEQVIWLVWGHLAEQGLSGFIEAGQGGSGVSPVWPDGIELLDASISPLITADELTRG